MTKWDALKETLQSIYESDDPHVSGVAKYIAGLMETIEKNDFYSGSDEVGFSFMPVWRSTEEMKPSRPGDYLVLTELGPSEKDEQKECCEVSVAKYWPRGYLIPYMPSIPPEKRGKLTAKERMDRILYPHYWETQGGWYEIDDTDIGLRLLDPESIIYWAELPKTPDFFAGDQNEFLRTWHDGLMRSERKTRVVLDESAEVDDRK